MIDMRFDDIHHLSGWWFQPTPLKHMTSSVGMMNFPYIMESHESYVPNHQPDKIASHMWYIYMYLSFAFICLEQSCRMFKPRPVLIISKTWKSTGDISAKNVGVSINGDPKKWMVYKGKSPSRNGWFRGTPMTQEISN